MGLVFIENDLFWVYDKNTGFWKIEVVAVMGCPMEFDMYVYIHIGSGIYLRSIVSYGVGWFTLSGAII